MRKLLVSLVCIAAVLTFAAGCKTAGNKATTTATTKVTTVMTTTVKPIITTNEATTVTVPPMTTEMTTAKGTTAAMTTK